MNIVNILRDVIYILDILLCGFGTVRGNVVSEEPLEKGGLLLLLL